MLQKLSHGIRVFPARSRDYVARRLNPSSPPRQHSDGNINFLGRIDNLHTIKGFLADWASFLQPEINIFTYEDLPQPDRLPPGLWIFADVDRLSSANLETAVIAWHTLKARYGPHVRLLNQPGISLPRKALLKQLEAAGRNRFTVHDIVDWRDVRRFPVFIRYSCEHFGTLTPLLENTEMLSASLAELETRAVKLEDLLIVEFLDTSEQGLFRKYSAFRAGDTILAHHVFHSQHWHVKNSTLEITAETIAEEWLFQKTNPHLAELRAIFDLACIDYGRIDYAMLDGAVQTWEINTNPTILAPPAYYQPDHMPAKLWFTGALTQTLRDMAQATL